MNGEVEIRILRTLEEFAASQAGWDELVVALPRPSPFLLHGWLMEWWRHNGAGQRLAVVVAVRDGSLVGAVPLAIRRRFGLDVAGFVGGADAGIVDILVAADEPEQTGNALAAAVAGSEFDLLDVFGLPGESRLARSLPGLKLIERVESPVLLMPDGFEIAYGRVRSSRRRKQDRRRLTKLEETHTVEFRLATSEPELGAALDDAFDIHAHRWQGRNDRSGFSDASGRDFQRAALEAVMSTAKPHILTMTIDNKPAAFQYWFMLGTTMIGCRRGFDPAYAEYSPGLVTMLRALELAASEGVNRVEFLGGGERYKLEFADRQEPLYQAIGLPRGARGHLGSQATYLLTTGRQRLRRSATLRRLYLERGKKLRFPRPR